MTTMTEMMDAIETFMKNHTEDLTHVKAAVEDVQKQQNRFTTFGGYSRSTTVSPAETKALANGVRALFRGNLEEAQRLFGEGKALSAGSDPDGGYVVHDVISAGMTKIMIEMSPIYRLARKVTLDRGLAFEEPLDKDAADASWVGEVAARPETDTPQLGMFRVELKEVYALPKASQTLIDQSDIDVLGWLQSKIGEAFATKEATAFHTGVGVADPRGILEYTNVATSDATRAWGQLEYLPSGASGAFHTTKMDPLHDMVGSLKAQYRRGAVWLMNRGTAKTLRKLKEATTDAYLWQTSVMAGQPDMLLGYPVEIDEYMPDIAANSLSLAFGNIGKAYCVVEKPGVRFLSDPYTSPPYVKVLGYRRVGAGIYNFEALKLMKFAAA